MAPGQVRVTALLPTRMRFANRLILLGKENVDIDQRELVL